MIHVRGVLVLFAIVLPALAQNPIRYMPFGDSTTDYGCWRAWLGQKLKQDGYNIDFVGTRKAEANCNNLDYDHDHEGHPGYQAVNIVKDKQLVGWLKQNPADIVTMHLGTVDIVLANRKAVDITSALSILVDQMRASNPIIRIIVAQIIPYPANDKLVQDLNKAIPAWAEPKNSTMSPIWVVDQWTGFTSSDLYDGIHPSASGDIKIADKYYPAMIRAIKSIDGGRIV